MATPRETLKYYFRKYALPTEQQFAELIDAFVHKDEDTLTQEKIDGLITELAGKVSKETFENFKTEIQGAITSSGSDLSALTAKVTTAESNITSLLDDVVTNADNISGLNQRVDALEERPQITVDSTLDSESTNPVENKAVTEALGGKADSADVTALSERVSTLENAEPPQVTGSYLKQIADLDSYEGTDGEIVQYIGATNDKYRRGFCYEKKAGETIVPRGLAEVTESDNTDVIPVGTKIIKYGEPHLVVKSFEQEGDRFCFGEPKVGGTILYNSGGIVGTITAVEEHGDDGYGRVEKFVTYYDNDIQGENTVYLSVQNNTVDAESSSQHSYITESGIKLECYQEMIQGSYANDSYVLANGTPVFIRLDINSLEGYEMPQLASGGWQVIPTSPCVN